MAIELNFESDVIICETPQKFLICITIQSAKRLNVLNADTFVLVTFNKTHRRTSIYNNSDCPYFNEYFVFEIDCTLNHLLKNSLLIRVIQKTWICRKDSLIGELAIDLRSIWESENHAIVGKWSQLERRTQEHSSINAGFIQVDLSIISKYEHPAPAKLETHSLDGKEVQRIRYTIHLYHGNFDVHSNFYLQINFGSHLIKTAVKKSKDAHVFNEAITFTDFYPSLCRSILVQVMVSEHCSWDQLSIQELQLQDMSFRSNSIDSLPSIGPTYIHFYNVKDPLKYVGSLLLSIYTEKVDDRLSMLSLNQTTISGLVEDDFWSRVNFQINFAVLSAEAFHLKADSVKVKLEIGSSISKEVSLPLTTYSNFKWKYAKFNTNSRPLVCLQQKLPDNREKYQPHTHTLQLHSEMKTSWYNYKQITFRESETLKVIHVKKLLKEFQSLLETVIVTKLKYTTYKLETLWEKAFLVYLKDEMTEMLTKFKVLSNKFNVADVERQMSECLKKLKKLGQPTLQNQNPILFVKVFVDGHLKMVAQLDTRDYFYLDGVNGFDCGNRKELYLKSVKCTHSCKNCGCITGKIGYLMWIIPVPDLTKFKPKSIVRIFAETIQIKAEKQFICKLYIYQGKIRNGCNKSGLCNPRLVACVDKFSAQSKVIPQTLSPIWKQTITVPCNNVSNIIIILFDQRSQDNEKQIGIGYIRSTIRNNNPLPHLYWIKLFDEGNHSAEILLAAEVIQSDQAMHDQVIIEDDLPYELKPEIMEFKVSAIFYGIRRNHKPCKHTAGKYKIELNVGELIISGGLSSNGDQSYDFLDPIAVGFVRLPIDFQYWPGIVLKHLDLIGKSVIGTATISSVDQFLTSKLNSEIPVEILKEVFHVENENVSLLKRLKSLEVKTKVEPKIKPINDHNFSWWTKYYNSTVSDPSAKKHKLTIYPDELERHFDYFQDWAKSVALYQGEKAKNDSYCQLKVKIQVEPVHEKPKNLRSMSLYKLVSFTQKERNILVRVYVVKGINLRSHDTLGHSDPYIQVDCGKTSINDRSSHVQNQVSPIFGRRFELIATLPRNHILKVSVNDRDETSPDDLIGSTEIDLEDRWYSHHLAHVGLPKEFNRIGYNAWRAKLLPSQILHHLCELHGLEGPLFIGGNKIQVGGITFEDQTKISLDETVEERLCLSALNQIEQFGRKLVPEHVETRSLYRPDRLGMEQGKLQLWIELHEIADPPAPIELFPEPAAMYELRIIVWNTADVVLNEENFFGKQMSDIYVKCWIDDIEKAQYTDIHYRSMTGDGNFNWRMIFPIKFSLIEDMMVVTKKKNLYEKFDTEIKIPATLKVQIWDNDSFSPDDFLGTTTLNLSSLPMPAATAKKCRLGKELMQMNLFGESKVRGWFPVYGASAKSEIIQTGKVELEMEIIPQIIAQDDPAGLGRNPPNALPMPKRPDASFKWFTSPWKSVKYIVRPQMKKCCLFCCVIFLLILFIFCIIFSVLHTFYL